MKEGWRPIICKIKNNLFEQYNFLTCSWRFIRSNRAVRIQIWNNNWDVETYRKKLENRIFYWVLLIEDFSKLHLMSKINHKPNKCSQFHFLCHQTSVPKLWNIAHSFWSQAKDRRATKNPVVNLELILMHHFSRILRLDLSSVQSTTLNSLVLLLHASQLISTITQNMVDQKC